MAGDGFLLHFYYILRDYSMPNVKISHLLFLKLN